MEFRRDLAGWGVRNIDGYNTEIMRRNLIKEYDDKGEPWKPLPYIVIIIDELADLMMTSGREVEESITRLPRWRARLVFTLCRDAETFSRRDHGIDQSKLPSRISFRVSSKIDSRTIIDTNGAEQLLGRGDMLFLPPGTSRLIRVHGAYIDETEITRIVSHIKAQGPPSYDESITQSDEEASWTGNHRRRTRRAFRRGFADLRRDETRIDFSAAAFCESVTAAPPRYSISWSAKD